MNYSQFGSFVILLALAPNSVFFPIHSFSHRTLVCMWWHIQFGFFIRFYCRNLTCAIIQMAYKRIRSNVGAPFTCELNSAHTAHSHSQTQTLSKFINWILALLCGLPCAKAHTVYFKVSQRWIKRWEHEMCAEIVCIFVLRKSKMEKSTTTFHFASFIISAQFLNFKWSFRFVESIFTESPRAFSLQIICLSFGLSVRCNTKYSFLKVHTALTVTLWIFRPAFSNPNIKWWAAFTHTRGRAKGSHTLANGIKFVSFIRWRCASSRFIHVATRF